MLLEVKLEGVMQGMGFWKCSVAEPMENLSWKRWVLLPFRFHWARFCLNLESKSKLQNHSFGKIGRFEL